MSVISNPDSSANDNPERLVDLSLYDQAYGKGIRMLADGSKSNVSVSKEEAKKIEEDLSSSKRNKRNKNRQRFNVSGELGTWVYKVQNARLRDNKIVYQKRYLYLKDDILYYSHNEFNPNVSIRKCNPIPLSSDMVFDYPSTIQDPQIQNNKSIDLHFENRVYTFVSDPQFPNSADFILTICATLNQMKECTTPPNDPVELNRMYLDTLNMIGIPETRWKTMIETEDDERKWILIVSNRKRMVAGDVLAQSCVNFLKQKDIPISEIRELRTIIGTSQKSFLQRFFELGGLAAIQEIMYEIVMNENRSKEDVQVLFEFFPIIQSLLKTRDMLMWCLSVKDFVKTLVMCAFIKNDLIITTCFTFLSIICNTEEGYNQVIGEFDDFMIFAQEKVRFQSVINLLTTASHVDVVITILVFFNSLIEKTLSIAQRMAIYTDLFLLDYHKLTESLAKKNPGSCEEINNIYNVFLKMYNDDREASIVSGIDTSDVENMILTIQAHTLAGSNWSYLCSVLRSLLVIPHDNLVGRSMWRMIATITNQIVTMSMKETKEYLSNKDVIDLIQKKQILDEKYEAIRDEDTIREQYRHQLHELQDELDEARAKVSPIQSSSDFSGHLVSDIIAQCSEYMSISYMREDPVYGKYFVMMESGVPLDDIARMCVHDGNDESVVRGPAIKLTPKQGAFSSSVSHAQIAQPGQPGQPGQSTQPQVDPNDPRNNPEYKKWFKLLDMGIPKEHVVLKMEQQGIDTSILDYVSPVQSVQSAQPQVDPNDPRNNPEYKKWFKLLDMGIPKEHVVLKMEQQGIDPSILDYVSPIQSAQPQVDPNDPRNNPEYKKWFKLLDMGIPKEHVALKMEQQGIDPSILDYASPVQPAQPVQQEEIMPQRKQKKEEKPKEEKKSKSVRRKLKREPETRMKNIYWDGIDDDKIDASAWKDMDDLQVDIDYQDLSNYFRAKENVVLAARPQVDPSIRKQEEMVQLITDDKRLRNVSMSIARLKISTEVLVQAIYRVDDSILDNDMIRILFENAPTPEEVEIVKGYEGKVELLGDVDRFFKELSTIPNLQTRLKCIHIRSTLKNDLEDIRCDFDAFDVAMRKCYESESFYTLMQLILAIGNYMNGTTTRGGLYGFQISFLPRLADIKSVDNKTSLLEYIYMYMEKERDNNGKNKKLIQIIDDFEILLPLKGKDYNQLQQEFKTMNDGFELVGRQRNAPKVNQDDRFSSVMSSFYDSMRDDIAGVKRSMENADMNYQNFRRKYACPNDYKLSAIIDDLSTFFQQFVTIREEITKKRAIEEDLRRRKEANERMHAQMQEQKRQQLAGNENDLIDSYQTMRKNQMKNTVPYPSRGEMSMLGTMKIKKMIMMPSHSPDHTLNALGSRQRSGHLSNTLSSGNLFASSSRDSLLMTPVGRPSSPSKRFSFTLRDGENPASSMDQIPSPPLSPPSLRDATLTLTSRERMSIFSLKSPVSRQAKQPVTRQNKRRSVVRDPLLLYLVFYYHPNTSELHLLHHSMLFNKHNYGRQITKYISLIIYKRRIRKTGDLSFLSSFTIQFCIRPEQGTQTTRFSAPFKGGNCDCSMRSLQSGEKSYIFPLR